MTDLINEPDPARTIMGLRDTGYSFKTAAADIIDNSIAANADTVNVSIEMSPDGRKFVYFGDNGDGMNEEETFMAMRYGAPKREDLASLGKFGLGLKTASSSVCQHFAIISRKTPKDDYCKLAWDMEHVVKMGKWEMLSETITADEVNTFEELCGEKGTLLIWSKCDRILTKNFTEAGGTKEKQALNRLAGGLSDHISLTFHRFIDFDDKRERNIIINVNNIKTDPWNPFYVDKSEKTLAEDNQTITLADSQDQEIGTANIQAWILPHHTTLTSDQKNIAKISNRRQGFYIYRQGRLINEGGWLGVFGAQGTLEPHMSLLRVEFDFGYELDELFSVDVKKSKISFDPNVEEYLQTLLSPSRRAAEMRYRKKDEQRLAKKTLSHQSSNVSIADTNIKKPIIESTNFDNQTVVLSNVHGPSIRIKKPIQNNVEADKIFVEAVETIKSGDLWVPALRSSSNKGHEPGVELNKHHDFYRKIYQRAGSDSYSVQGMDLLLWAFSVSELDYSNDELGPIFDEIREEVSRRLRKLLRDVPLPDGSEIDSQA
jgi:hypothetical protein